MKMKKLLISTATALSLTSFGTGFINFSNHDGVVVYAASQHFYNINKAIKFTKTVNGKKIVGVNADIVYSNSTKDIKEDNGKLAGTHVVNDGKGKYQHMAFYTPSEFQEILDLNKKQGGETYNVKKILSKAKEGQTIFDYSDAIIFYE